MDSDYSFANKELRQTICRLREKSLILRRFVEQSKATPTDTHETIDFGKEEVFTLTEVGAAKLRLKSGKAASENEIRPEVLKASNGEGVHWLTSACQVAWELGKTSKNSQTGVIISKYKKSN